MKLPASNWSWWKVATMALFTFGSLSVLLTFYPYYLRSALIISLVLSISGVLVSVRFIVVKDWVGQVIFINSWLLLLLGIAIRSWTYIIPVFWLWLALIGSFYIFTWLVPILMPRLSKTFLREQITPRTKLGRLLFKWSLILIPAAGGIGATIGYYGDIGVRFHLPSLITGILLTVGVLGIAQALSHQMWPQRPWAQHDTSKEG
jgi:hypothetical protein